ncbi:MAG TPA: hypothetical protein HA362_07670 [Nanoarchaeota archaeon]|nr:hypothetical protein [Nanoarchaeota archaeon]
MKKIEFVFRELLFQCLEKGNRRFTQLGLSKELGLSTSMISFALKPLKKMNAVEIRQRGFSVVEPRKVLYHWASVRNIEKDIVYSTRAEMPVVEIEKAMPDDIVYGAYSAYRIKFKDAPADYSEVYVYGDETLKKRFPEAKGPANIFVLKKDISMERYGKLATMAQAFVDLWNIKTWYASDYLKALEARINERILE